MTCLEMFRQKEYAWVDVISEAPVRCLVFWAKNDFVILWYNKLKGAERAILVMKEILPQKETTIVLDKAILE